MPETFSEKNRSCRKKSVIKKSRFPKKGNRFLIEHAMKNNLAAVDEVIFIEVIWN